MSCSGCGCYDDGYRDGEENAAAELYNTADMDEAKQEGYQEALADIHSALVVLLNGFIQDGADDFAAAIETAIKEVEEFLS